MVLNFTECNLKHHGQDLLKLLLSEQPKSMLYQLLVGRLTTKLSSRHLIQVVNSSNKSQSQRLVVIKSHSLQHLHLNIMVPLEQPSQIITESLTPEVQLVYYLVTSKSHPALMQMVGDVEFLFMDINKYLMIYQYHQCGKMVMLN